MMIDYVYIIGYIDMQIDIELWFGGVYFDVFDGGGMMREEKGRNR